MYKRNDHTVSYELEFEKNDPNVFVIPIDTSVSSLLEAVNKPYNPQYSGDIVDASYDGLMSHVANYKSSKTTVEQGKESLTYLQELEKHRSAPELDPNKTIDNPI